MKIFNALISFVFLMAMAACGHSDSYTVTGSLTDGSTQNLRVYCMGQKGISSSISAALEGKFRYEQPLRETSLIEIYDNDYRLLVRFLVDPGDDINLEIDRSNRYLSKIDGNKDSKEWSQWLNANSETLAGNDVSAINTIVASYVAAHPDSRVSEMLLSTVFSVEGHEVEADSLYHTLSTEILEYPLIASFGEEISRMAQGSKATVEPLTFVVHGNYRKTFSPADSRLNLYVLTAEQSGRDTIFDEMENLARFQSDGRLAILDLGLHQDSIPWSRDVKGDSVSWTQGWLAGGPAAPGIEPLGLPRLPFYIVADSKGRQLWRGSNIKKASAEIIRRL